jgi:diguanylate cyclase (GGDEF)-like protein/PAS domain S-box-containing protein
VVLAYLAIVVTGVRRPAELLFRQVVEKERELASTNTLLAESEDRLNRAQTVAGVGSWSLDVASSQLAWSDEAYRIFGLALGTPLTMEAFVSCIHPDDREAVLSAWSTTLTGAPYDIEHRIVADGQTKWVHERAEVHFSPEGVALAGLGTVQDITERKVAEEARQESEDRFRNTLEHAPIGMALISPDGKFVQVNQAFCNIVGYATEELLNLTFETITHPEDVAKDVSFVKRMEAGEIPSYEIEKRYLHKDGRIVWVQITGSMLRDVKGAPRQIIKQVQDITERKDLTLRLERQAHTDFLTGLVNRGHFLELAAQELARVRRYRSPLSVAMLDLDHFKTINDTYGHGVGDKVLIELAEICRRTLRGPDVIGRIGGEEFAILLPETTGDQAYEVIERLRETIASTEIPMEHGLPVHFTASIGITSVANSDTNIEVLLNRADQALYEAKRNGRNRVVPDGPSGSEAAI